MNVAPRTLISICAMTLLLTACEFRQDGLPEPEPVQTEVPIPAASGTAGPAPAATPSPESEESPVASIIRDEARAEELAPPVQPLSVTVPFGSSGNLSEASERVLMGVLESEALREGWPVILRGHTDSSGNDSANLRASRSRAEAVAAWLVERGVADDRISVIAFGEQNPIAPNAKPDGSANEAGRARNRRVDIEIAPVATRRPANSATQINEGA